MLASPEGQRIFQIDGENLNQVMPQLNLDFLVENEIRDSVRAGHIVITHTHNVSVLGFNGSGYLVLDPDTLIGAYKISGGNNGGWFTLSLIATFSILLAAPSLLISLFAGDTALVAPIYIAALVALASGLTIANLILGADFEEFEQEAAVIGFIASATVFTTTFLAAAILRVALLPLLPLILGWIFFLIIGSVIVYRFS